MRKPYLESELATRFLCPRRSAADATVEMFEYEVLKENTGKWRRLRLANLGTLPDKA